MAKRQDSPTLYAYVKDYIMKLIISGKYPADSKLPTEFELMDTLDVGRATVRAALAQLEQEGTIYKRQGVGTFVAKRNKLYGLEPFISLSFALKHLGVSENNEILEQRKLLVGDNELSNHWNKGTEVFRIKRLRKIGNTVIALEDNYYSSYSYYKLNEKDLAESLAHNLLTYLDKPIVRIENQQIVRNPQRDEAEALEIQPSEKIIEIIRWMWVEDSKEPINYGHLLIPSHVLEFPFLG